jgi:hypothetical protein
MAAPAMKRVGPRCYSLAGASIALALEIERHCSADEILQGRLIDLRLRDGTLRQGIRV